MAAYILDTLIEWPGSRSEEERQILGRATEATTLDTLAALVTGDDSHLTNSFEPSENVTYYIRNRIPFQEVIRNVHTGQEFLVQELIDAIARLVPSEDRVAAISRMTRDVTACWSNFITQLSADYRRQHEEWSHSAEGNRARLIRNLLHNRNTDPVEAGRMLKYDLQQPHTGALVWFSGLDPEAVRLIDLPSLAHEIAEATESASHLAMTYPGQRIELWLGAPRRPAAEVLRQGPWPQSMRAAFGTPQAGVGGFVATHDEAMAAGRVAWHSSNLGRVVNYPDIELLSLLTADLELARRFVSRVLGPIAGTDARSVELRDTLRAWIDSSQSIAATSQALYLHRNTVNYRLKQINELLGDDLNPTSLRCALVIVDSLPDLMAN
ncbi:helix-turn-helix domain-containing protein [Streptomyces sp. NPDC046909]|uniref:PucR family transcriptional regulator n=1 Tax=Streptomyces sp. NPDC046909 TaxID=3155617 RepID=UPI0033ED77F1